MAELLVSRRMRNNRRGEVVTVQRDGWPWSEKERRSGMFEVLKFPGVRVERFADLLAPKTAVIDGETVQIARRQVRITDVDTAKTATTETSLRQLLGEY